MKPKPKELPLLNVKFKGKGVKRMENLAQDIQKRSGFDLIIIHLTAYAVAATSSEWVYTQGYYCPHPKTTTGGGDNFNAGFCTGMLYGFSLKESLICGVATSGFYVRKGHSPTIKELASFLKSGY